MRNELKEKIISVVLTVVLFGGLTGLWIVEWGIVGLYLSIVIACGIALGALGYFCNRNIVYVIEEYENEE